MIKSAILFFEHQLPFAQKVLPFLEEKHPVLLIDEMLSVDSQGFIKISFSNLKRQIRALRVTQVICPLLPKQYVKEIAALKKALKCTFIIGIEPLMEDSVMRFERMVQKSSLPILDRSIEELRYSTELLLDEYEEPLMGGLCQEAPKANITRAPKIVQRKPVISPIEFKTPICPFGTKKPLTLKADDPKRPAAALLLEERIRRGK